MPKLMSLGEVAKRLNCETWHVRRIFEKKLLPEPQRAGTYRVVSEADVPAIREVLARLGYLREPVA